MKTDADIIAEETASGRYVMTGDSPYSIAARIYKVTEDKLTAEMIAHGRDVLESALNGRSRRTWMNSAI